MKASRPLGSYISISFFGSGQDDYLRFAFANVDEEQIKAMSGRLAGLQIA